MYTVELWVDSNPSDSANSRAVRVVAAPLEEHHEFKGLYALRQPLLAALPSGLSVKVTCERVASGEFNCGVSHDGALASVGKYKGTFTVRVFPPGHQSYVLDVKAPGHATAGA